MNKIIKDTPTNRMIVRKLKEHKQIEDYTIIPEGIIIDSNIEIEDKYVYNT